MLPKKQERGDRALDSCRLVLFDRFRLLEVDVHQDEEHDGLDDRDEEFEEPEGEDEQFTEVNSEERDFSGQKGDDSDQYGSGKDITEETEREREELGEFSDKVEPSDEDVDAFFHSAFPVVVEEESLEVRERPLVVYGEYLRQDDDRCCHRERRIQVAVDRAEIVRESRNEEIEPIEEERYEISNQDEEEESGDQKKETASECLVFHEVGNEIVEGFYQYEPGVLDSRQALRSECDIEKGGYGQDEGEDDPGRKNSRRYLRAKNSPTFDRFARHFWNVDRGSLVRICCGCRFVVRCFGHTEKEKMAFFQKRRKYMGTRRKIKFLLGFPVGQDFHMFHMTIIFEFGKMIF